MAMIFIGGTTSVVETGTRLGGGDSVVDTRGGTNVGVSVGMTGEVPAGETPGAQANRTRVQRRTGRSFLISA